MRFPKLLLPSSCLVIFFFVSTAVFPQETAIFEAENQRFKAQMAKDGLALQQLLHDDLYYLHSNGLIETKQDFISSVNSGKIVYSSMKAQNQRLSRYGRTAVITGLVMVDGSYQGQHFTIGLFYTSVYIKKRGQWLLVNWQSTKQP